MKTIFFGANPSIVKYAYTDIINTPDIEYCDFTGLERSPFRKFMFRRKIQDFVMRISLPLAKFMYKKLLKYNFLKMSGIGEGGLFLFTCQYQYFFLTSFFSFISFLKRVYPRAKFAFYYNDIIESCYPEALPKLLQEFDYVLTFDKLEAEKYNMLYYGEVYSINKVPNDMDIASFDVFYVGSDRGRLDLILKVFDRCLSLGKVCRFYLYDILPENRNKMSAFIRSHKGVQIAENGSEFDIQGSYLSINNYCPYPKTLYLIQQCSCLVEIVLPGQNAGSLRVCESVTYRRKLITNCQSVKDRNFFNPNNICVFSNAEEITEDFFDRPYVEVQNPGFSPLKLIEYIMDKSGKMRDSNTINPS